MMDSPILSPSPGKFTMDRGSSKEPRNAKEKPISRSNSDQNLTNKFDPSVMESGMRLMFMANEGDLEGIVEALQSGFDVNFRDIDSRTPLHIASCQGFTHVVEFLVLSGASIHAKDRWGSTPLADAIYYKNQQVIDLLEKYGAQRPMPPMHVHNDNEIPEYEINQKELDFSNSVNITKGTYRKASWGGVHVAVKTLGDDVITDEEKIKAFKDELALLQRLRHPNVVQFLGAVTQTTPLMIVTEYLPKGDLRAFLEKKGALKPIVAVKFALNIARGMNYLHEHKPEAIIHRDLDPSNILRDYSGRLKVADFGLSKLLKASKTNKKVKPVSGEGEGSSCRYAAPELFKNEEYDSKVDVFSFALIFQEMIEGCPPFALKPEKEVPVAYCSNERPPFRAPPKNYAYGVKELIERCWHEDPHKRPTFRQIICCLEEIRSIMERKRLWKRPRKYTGFSSELASAL